jgi:transmembrane sensor
MEQNNIERIWSLMARKLSEEASEIELTELEQLLRQQPGENYSLEIMQDLWKSQAKIDRQHSENEYKALIYRLRQMGIDDGKFDEQDHYINNEEQEPQLQTKKRKHFLLYGALLIVLISTALFFYNRQPQKEEQAAGNLAKNEISTKYGSKTNLVLPDGTKVWLNAGSKLTYDKNYAGTLREVSLVGEAYFDVVKDPRRPFIIHTSKMDIKVLGTAFNVKCYPGDKHTETSLVRGSIEITLKDRTDKIILKPNEKLIITDNEPLEKKLAAEGKKEEAQEPMIALSHLTREPVNNDILETSWVDNKLVFNSETFEEIVIKMERWYGVEINLNNEKIKKKRFTGTFENETIDQALSAMQLTMPFTYVIKKDHIIISQ